MIVKAEFTSAIDSRSVDRNAKSSRFIEDMTRADVDPSTLPVKTTTKSSAKTFGGTRNHFNQQDATNTQNQRLSRENTRTAKKLAAFQEAYSKTFRFACFGFSFLPRNLFLFHHSQLFFTVS
jgi:hypothetical protein